MLCTLFEARFSSARTHTHPHAVDLMWSVCVCVHKMLQTLASIMKRSIWVMEHAVCENPHANHLIQEQNNRLSDHCPGGTLSMVMAVSAWGVREEGCQHKTRTIQIESDAGNVCVCALGCTSSGISHLIHFPLQHPPSLSLSTPFRVGSIDL